MVSKDLNLYNAKRKSPQSGVDAKKEQAQVCTVLKIHASSLIKENEVYIGKN